MKKSISLVFVLIVSVAVCAGAFATDYYIEDYNVDVEVGNNAVHSVQETLRFNFQNPRHGFYREIPYDYTDYSGVEARITDLSCSDPYETERSNGYLVMKIGSADTTVQGRRTYEISYDYDLYADTNEDYDEFYFNILGAGWECPVWNVTFSIRIPYVQGYDLASILKENVWFTRGVYGSTASNGVTYRIEMQSDGSAVISGSASSFAPYEALTLRVQLPDGWYKDARQPWDLRDVFAVLNPVFSVLLLVLAAAVWMLYGRDPVPIVSARFEAPDGLSPLLVGYLADKSPDDKDIISMLFYWADKGLLSITEEKTDKFTFTKLKDIEQYAIETGTDVPALEVQLFNGFFKGCEVGDTIDFKDLEKNNFYECMTSVKGRVLGYFRKDRRLAETKSEVLSAVFGFVAIIPMMLFFCRLSLMEFPRNLAFGSFIAAFLLPIANTTAFFLLFRKWYLRKSNVFPVVLCAVPSVCMFGILASEGMAMYGTSGVVQAAVSVLCSTMISFLSAIMPKRSAYGNKMLEQTLGYREFIDKVEMSVLKMLIDEDPMVYYHVLGYAVVLGLEGSWANKFKGITIPPATWYNGPTAFDVYYFSRMASRMSRVVPAAAIPKTSSSSNPGAHVGGSSFGGGGFSGGGFGGGGGRAW